MSQINQRRPATIRQTRAIGREIDGIDRDKRIISGREGNIRREHQPTLVRDIQLPMPTLVLAAWEEFCAH